MFDITLCGCYHKAYGIFSGCSCSRTRNLQSFVCQDCSPTFRHLEKSVLHIGHLHLVLFGLVKIDHTLWSEVRHVQIECINNLNRKSLSCLESDVQHLLLGVISHIFQKCTSGSGHRSLWISVLVLDLRKSLSAVKADKPVTVLIHLQQWCLSSLEECIISSIYG